MVVTNYKADNVSRRRQGGLWRSVGGRGLSMTLVGKPCILDAALLVLDLVLLVEPEVAKASLLQLSPRGTVLEAVRLRHGATRAIDLLAWGVADELEQ